MSRAHMKDEAYRAVIYYTNKAGEYDALVIGPYATVGAARGQATSKRGSIERWYGGTVTAVHIQRATGWRDVQ